MKFVLSSQNKKKLEEMSRILEPMGIELVTAADMGFTEDVEETGTTFEENAFIKAEAACKALGMPAIADDSGLCVDYLDGAPGVFSARFAGEQHDDEMNNDKLLSLLDGVPKQQRSAKYVSVICTVFPDGRSFCVRGECHGHIGTRRQGSGGFGYDPLFIVEGSNRTFGEYSPSEKDAVSHRGNSLRKFERELPKYLEEINDK